MRVKVTKNTARRPAAGEPRVKQADVHRPSDKDFVRPEPIASVQAKDGARASFDTKPTNGSEDAVGRNVVDEQQLARRETLALGNNGGVCPRARI